MADDDTVFQLRIELKGVDPPVWRRLLVPGDPSLRILHRIFQVAMGWRDRHLHQLTVEDDVCYVADAEDAEEDDVYEDDVSVAEALGGRRRARYEYDFGDGWVHEVTIEREWTPRDDLRFAVCLEGEHACPPEDVGGPRGYAEFLKNISDPDNEARGELLSQTGGAFDPDAFDIIAVNVALQHLR